MVDITQGAASIMTWFEYDHLPEHLQVVSKPFRDLAEHLEAHLSASPERTMCLRKLLEAKDCAVRSALTGVGWKKDATVRPCTSSAPHDPHSWGFSLEYVHDWVFACPGVAVDELV